MSAVAVVLSLSSVSGIAVVVVSSLLSVVSSPTRIISLPFDGSDHHLRRPELKDLWHAKVGDPIDAQIEGFDVWNIPVGRLGDNMRSQWSRQPRHTDLKMVLKDLIGRPSVLSRFGIMNVFSVCQDGAFSAVERPRKNDFVFAATAIGSGLSGGNGGGIGDTKLEDNLLFGKPKSLGGVFDTVVDCVGAEDVRHGWLVS